MPNESYYAAVIRYVSNYLCKIGDRFPKSDAKLWKMMDGRTVEYSQAVKIRDNATSPGKELKRNPRMGNRERENYAAADYKQILGTIAYANGETKGVLIEWGKSEYHTAVSRHCWKYRQ